MNSKEITNKDIEMKEITNKDIEMKENTVSNNIDIEVTSPDEVKYFAPCKKPTSIEEHVEVVFESLKNNTAHHLHKKARYKTPDAGATFTLSPDYFVKSDTSRMCELFKLLPPCLGLYNGRMVFDYGGYFIGIPPIECAKRFRILRITVTKKDVIEKVLSLKKEGVEAVTADLYDYAGLCSCLLKDKIGTNIQYSPKYEFFKRTENPSADNEIVKRITRYYNDDLKGIDLRTNTPLAESYFIFIGWLFAPVEKERRLAGCFECKTSGIGKTAFVQCLCKRVDAVFGSISQPVGKANTFSFSPTFAQGPDIVNVDDPCNGMADIMASVSDVVSNKRAQVELKGKDRYMLDDLDTKIYISTNIPVYLKNDTNNFLTAKLFVLKANDTLADDSLPVDRRSNKICDYILGCDKSIVEEFLSYCVQQYETHGVEFIKTHMGNYIDSEAERDLFEDVLDSDKLNRANIGITTLIECVADDMCRSDRDLAHNDQVLKCWNILCKHIQTQWSTIARDTVCSVPRDNGIYPVGSRPSKARYKNYVITQELRDKILERLNANTHNEAICTHIDVDERTKDKILHEICSEDVEEYFMREFGL